MAIFYPQKILTTNKTEVTFAYNNYSSMIFANNGSASVTMDLYVTSQLGTYITNPVLATGVYANFGDGYPVGYNAAIVIDNGSGGASAGTSDMFLNERVYKSDGKLFGVCTTFNSNVQLTFSGGLETAITDNNILYVGTRYYFLKNVKIPKGVSLKLTADEFKFDTTNYKLYINSSSSTGDIDIITRY